MQQRPIIILYIATCRAGFIADEQGGVDYLMCAELPGEDFGYGDLLASIDALVVGKTTYEQILTFGKWPYAGKQTFVVTRTPLTTARNDINFVNSIQAFMEAINTQPSIKKVWLVGGAELTKGFYDAGLIDECIITVVPTTLNAGIALPPELLSEGAFVETIVRTYPNGTVQRHYKKITQDFDK
jgi:dihydrofolate reductase